MALKGNIPWNKGKKGLQVAWNKGKKLDLELREKLSKAHFGKMIGADNPAWKGGITPLTIKMRNKFVKTIGRQVLARDNYTCRIYQKRGGDLPVDHIQSWSEYAEGRFSMDNCRTLCVECHYLITFGKSMPADSSWGRRMKYLGA